MLIVTLNIICILFSTLIIINFITINVENKYITERYIIILTLYGLIRLCIFLIAFPMGYPTYPSGNNIILLSTYTF